MAEPAEPAPSLLDHLDIQDLDGQRWNRDTVDGRVVLLDFWATWCAPCLAQMPHLAKLHDRFGDRGFILLGINLDGDSRNALRSWLRRQNLPWPQIHGPRGLEGPLAQDFGVEALPRTLLFDTEGRLVARDLSAEALDAAVEALVPRTSR